MSNAPNLALVWNPELSVHLEYLDHQHRSILRLIDVWWHKLQTGKFNPTRNNLAKIFDFLNTFTQQHLELEERVLDILVKSFGYPAGTAKGHKLRHNTFRTEIMARFHSDIRDLARSGDSGMDQLLPIAKWWVNHIKTEDADYAGVLEKLSYKDREKLYKLLIDSLIERPIILITFRQFLDAMRDSA